MQTMKNKVGRNLARTWPGKHLIKVGQKVDEVWMAIGQYLVKSWSAFKAKEVGQNLDESWTDFGSKKVQQGYKQVTTILKTRICQGYANDMPEIRSNKLLQLFSNTSLEIRGQRLHQSYAKPTLKSERFSLKGVPQQLPNAYPENEDPSRNKSGQSRYEIGIKIVRWGFGMVSVRFRWFQGYKVGQFLGKTWVDLPSFYPAIKPVIQPLSFIAHSFIVHNKRVSYGYTKVTPTLHQECDQLLPNATRNRPLFSLFDITRVSLYVVLPDQNL